MKPHRYDNETQLREEKEKIWSVKAEVTQVLYSWQASIQLLLTDSQPGLFATSNCTCNACIGGLISPRTVLVLEWAAHMLSGLFLKREQNPSQINIVTPLVWNPESPILLLCCQHCSTPSEPALNSRAPKLLPWTISVSASIRKRDRYQIRSTSALLVETNVQRVQSHISRCGMANWPLFWFSCCTSLGAFVRV